MPGICSTCLSDNRTLKPLDLMKKHMTLEWLQVDFLPAGSSLCWECSEDLRHADRFRWRAKEAQYALQSQQPLRSLSNLAIAEICHDDYVHSKTDDVLEKIKNIQHLTIIVDKNTKTQISEEEMRQIDIVEVGETDVTPKNSIDEDQQSQTDTVSDITNSENAKNPADVTPKNSMNEDQQSQTDKVSDIDNSEKAKNPADVTPKNSMDEDQQCQTDKVSDIDNSGSAKNPADVIPNNSMDEDQQCQTDKVSDIINCKNTNVAAEEDKNCRIENDKTDNVETTKLHVKRHIDIIKVCDTDTPPIPSVNFHIEKMLKKLNQSMNNNMVKLFTIIEETGPIISYPIKKKHGNIKNIKTEPKTLNYSQCKPQSLHTNSEFDITDPNFNIMEPIVEITESNYDTQQNVTTGEPEAEKTKPISNIIDKNVAATEHRGDKNIQTVDKTVVLDNVITIEKTVYEETQKTQYTIVKSEPLVNVPDSTSDFTESANVITESGVNITEPNLNLIEPNINIFEPNVNIFEPNINVIEPAIPPETNITVPTYNNDPNVVKTEPAVDIYEPIFDTFQRVVDTEEPEVQRPDSDYNNLSVDYKEIVYRNTQVSDGWPVLTVSGVTNVVPTPKSLPSADAKLVPIKDSSINSQIRVTSSGGYIDPNLSHGIQILPTQRTLAEQLISTPHIYEDGDRISKEFFLPLIRPKGGINTQKKYIPATAMAGSNLRLKNMMLIDSAGTKTAPQKLTGLQRLQEASKGIASKPIVKRRVRHRVPNSSTGNIVQTDHIVTATEEEALPRKNIENIIVISKAVSKARRNIIQKDSILTEAVQDFPKIVSHIGKDRMIAQNKSFSTVKTNIQKDNLINATEQNDYSITIPGKNIDRMMVQSKAVSKARGTKIHYDRILTEAVQDFPTVVPRKDKHRMIVQSKAASQVKGSNIQKNSILTEAVQDFPITAPRKDNDRMIVHNITVSKAKDNIIKEDSILTEAVQDFPTIVPHNEKHKMIVMSKGFSKAKADKDNKQIQLENTLPVNSVFVIPEGGNKVHVLRKAALYCDDIDSVIKPSAMAKLPVQEIPNTSNDTTKYTNINRPVLHVQGANRVSNETVTQTNKCTRLISNKKGLVFVSNTDPSVKESSDESNSDEDTQELDDSSDELDDNEDTTLINRKENVDGLKPASEEVSQIPVIDLHNSDSDTDSPNEETPLSTVVKQHNPQTVKTIQNVNMHITKVYTKNNESTAIFVESDDEEHVPIIKVLASKMNEVTKNAKQMILKETEIKVNSNATIALNRAMTEEETTIQSKLNIVGKIKAIPLSKLQPQAFDVNTHKPPIVINEQDVAPTFTQKIVDIRTEIPPQIESKSVDSPKDLKTQSQTQLGLLSQKLAESYRNDANVEKSQYLKKVIAYNVSRAHKTSEKNVEESASTNTERPVYIIHDDGIERIEADQRDIDIENSIRKRKTLKREEAESSVKRKINKDEIVTNKRKRKSNETDETSILEKADKEIAKIENVERLRSSNKNKTIILNDKDSETQNIGQISDVILSDTPDNPMNTNIVEIVKSEIEGIKHSPRKRNKRKINTTEKKSAVKTEIIHEESPTKRETRRKNLVESLESPSKNKKARKEKVENLPTESAKEDAGKSDVNISVTESLKSDSESSPKPDKRDLRSSAQKDRDKNSHTDEKLSPNKKDNRRMDAMASKLTDMNKELVFGLTESPTKRKLRSKKSDHIEFKVESSNNDLKLKLVASTHTKKTSFNSETPEEVNKSSEKLEMENISESQECISKKTPKKQRQLKLKSKLKLETVTISESQDSESGASSRNEENIKLERANSSENQDFNSEIPSQDAEYLKSKQNLETVKNYESQEYTSGKKTKREEKLKRKSKLKLETVTTAKIQDHTDDKNTKTEDNLKEKPQSMILMMNESHDSSSEKTSKSEETLKIKLAKDSTSEIPSKSKETLRMKSEKRSTSESPTKTEEKRKSKSKNQLTPYAVTYITEEELWRKRDMERKQEAYLQFPFKCETCIKSFVSNYDYKTHVEHFHSEKSGPYLCSICAKRFRKEKTLRKHYKSHKRAYKCTKCGFRHHQEDAMVSHVNDLHELHKCQFCDSQFKQPSDLSDHVLDAHMSSKALRRIPERLNKKQKTSPKKKHPFECDICGQGANNRSSLKKHILLQHRPRIVMNEGVDSQLAIVYR